MVEVETGVGRRCIAAAFAAAKHVHASRRFEIVLVASHPILFGHVRFYLLYFTGYTITIARYWNTILNACELGGT